MRATISMLIMVLFFGQTQSQTYQDSLIILAGKLEKAYERANEEPLEFFELFPKTFSQFTQLYGYDDKKGEHVLYRKYTDHVTFICGNNKIPARDKLQKMISIGVNGKWDADAVSMLQRCTLNSVKGNIKTSLQILSALNEADILSFWTYLFDGPHPNDQENRNNFEALHKSVMEIDVDHANLMEKAFKIALHN